MEEDIYFEPYKLAEPKPEMDMEVKEQSKRKVWTRKETLGLLKCYKARKDEFMHSRKKKFAFANVLEDMINQGLTDSSTTAEALQGKIQTLQKAYKAAKYKQRQGRVTPIEILYGKEIDEIFGNQPKITIKKNLHIGFDNEQPHAVYKPAAPTSPTLPSTSDSAESAKRFCYGGDSSAPRTLATSSPSSSVASDRMDSPNLTKKSSLEKYLDERLKIKRELGERKLQQRENFLSEMKKSLEQKWAIDTELRIKAEEHKERIMNALKQNLYKKESESNQF